MIFRNGERSDSEQLTEMRVEYLKADWGTLTEEQEAAVKEQLPGYLERDLGESLTAYVAEENGRLAGTVLMLIVEKPAGPSALNGKTGTLMNVYVLPEYRKLGLGAKLVTMALEDARQRGLCHVDLQATAQGRKLYEYLGFQKSESHYTPMVFEL
ncbi:GNAT family N-acetyltransferase [Faecalispora anaeroviscerum]|uniref:GNAT family N-acetyltransferase n=1 Tax=Faecalispora anaeroviscerum TaxID=2991836 RepID=UPI0024B90DFD|nr:GNAT family N-acetyltransferase [Faecalispora anaeroviscerum]